MFLGILNYDINYIVELFYFSDKIAFESTSTDIETNLSTICPSSGAYLQLEIIC